MSRYDIVVYGATGFAGQYIVRALATHAIFKGKTIAVAGRSEDKVRSVLEDLAKETGNAAITKYPIIVADSSKDESLANMAKQARVIINAVGPYILYGEAVVRAAINNGASHVDISGEPAFLEKVALKYDKLAREKGVFVVGACGWDSIPCDLGADFVKRSFDGTLCHLETFVRINRGRAGYSLNGGTYDSVLLAIQSFVDSNFRRIHREIMPEPTPQPKYSAPCRFPLTKVNEPSITSWALPFLGSDKSIVERSQYYDFHVNGKRPIKISTYFSFGSFFRTFLVSLWLSVVSFFALFSCTRNILHRYPDQLSFGMFKRAGPSLQQIKECSFDYFFFGTGWASGDNENERPTRKLAAVCHGPDPGYFCTSACVAAAALALVEDRAKLPREGGVMTTASALRDTSIYENLRTMGVTFDLIPKKKDQLL